MNGHEDVGFVDERRFDDWVDRYQREQTLQSAQIGDLTKNVAALSSDVKTLLDNQRGLFSRIHRPMQAG